MTIPATCPQTELALEFVQFALSPEVQAHKDLSLVNYEDGLPVTRAGLDLQMDKISQSMALDSRESDTAEYKAWAEELIGGYTRPVAVVKDELVMNYAFIAALNVCTGDMTMEEAVRFVESELGMYLKEIA